MPDRVLNRGLNRRPDRHPTRMLGGVHRPRPRNELVEVCRILGRHIRFRKRVAREDPHLFGPESGRYFLETLAEERKAVEIEAALRRVYGPPSPGETSPVARVWQERYPEFKSAREKRKWVKFWFKKSK